jgi:invasion protein IalB
MNSRSIYVILLGALFAAGMNLPFSADSQAGSAQQMAELGDATKQVAQQDKPPAPAAAPKPATPAQSEGPGWAVNCKSAAADKGLECRLSQTIVTQNGQVLADVTFRVPADKKDPEAIVRLPLGILLSAGATLQVDDKPPQQLTVRTCDRNGCYARMPISTEMLATLQKGKQLQVSFKNLAEKSITVPLSLNGFSDAYAKI